MNLDDAIAAHASWKLKFRSVMSNKGVLDVATVSKDNCCMLGNWLYAEGKKLNGKAEYSDLVEKHKKFHIEAGKIAQLINSNKYDDAEKALSLGTPYTTASTAVGVAILALKKAANL